MHQELARKKETVKSTNLVISQNSAQIRSLTSQDGGNIRPNFSSNSIRVRLIQAYRWSILSSQATFQGINKIIFKKNKIIIKNMNKKMKKMNKMIKNMNEIIKNMNKMIKNINKMIKNMNKIIKNMNKIINNMNKTVKKMYKKTIILIVIVVETQSAQTQKI